MSKRSEGAHTGTNASFLSFVLLHSDSVTSKPLQLSMNVSAGLDRTAMDRLFVSAETIVDYKAEVLLVGLV